MSYTIGSFNTLNMSFQSDDKISKDYKKIAEIINSEGFDVVALQEVWTESALKYCLLPALNPQKWDFCWDSPIPFSSRSAEGYAFIWRKDRLRLVEANDNPMVYNRFRMRDYRNPKGLIRPPYVARFTPSSTSVTSANSSLALGGSFFEIRIINTHITFGKPSKLEVDVSDEAMRRQELHILFDDVYRLVSTKGYGDNMPSYTILLGDYNLCLVGKGPKIDSEISIKDGRIIKTVQSEPTTLRRPQNSAPSDNEQEENEEDVLPTEGVVDYYSHNYDHFSYEVSLLDKLSLSESRIEALGKYYNNDLEAFRKEVSDHVPIKLVLDIKI